MVGSAIHWFRKGLRIHDNPALLAVTEKVDGENCIIRPVFILDPWFVKNMRVGPNRWRFLQQSLMDLHESLKKMGSRLYVLKGKPEEVLPIAFRVWNVKLLTFELDIEPYARERDERIEALAKDAGVRVMQKISHTLFDTEAVIKANLGRPPLTYQKLISVVSGLGAPPNPVTMPDKFPKECFVGNEKADVHGEIPGWPEFNVPSLKDLGVKEEELGPNLHHGGETEALKRLSKNIAKKEWICKFEKPNTSPNSLQPSTTVLSPYLKFGCLSSRLFYYKLKEVTKGQPRVSQPPVSLIGQLLWREFYYVVGSATPNFDRMKGNPVCCQVPWNNNPEHLEAWTMGRTGYPFIDAIMTQLRLEGWIHHLARHAVACFLTRGDLWISWEEGQKVFEELLLDADWALNAGNWMWLSASAFFHQFFRVYSPVAFGKKTDKLGDYIRKYVPKLAKFPPQYIYEPWDAPLSVQKAAGCIIGVDYPKRIVIHESVSKANIQRMSAAYKSNKERKAGEEDEGAPKKSKGNTKKRASDSDPLSSSANKKSKTKGNKSIANYFEK
ncbi:cryptochrome-2 [Ischnura elegans]|uniref:cryptochrome-2 n=1 Tax=Ischnura elegans TaxID=197161 RepID=UPI001ED8BB77|nr:cryptochrome-2 [Ischnura elegans]